MNRSYGPTDKQIAALQRIHPEKTLEQIENMSFTAACRSIATHAEHWRRYPATKPQEVFLRTWGRWNQGLNRGTASDLIAEIKAEAAKMTPEQRTLTLELAKRKAAGFTF